MPLCITDLSVGASDAINSFPTLNSVDSLVINVALVDLLGVAIIL